jgi:hypothetical protein
MEVSSQYASTINNFIVLTKLHCMESSFVEVVSSEVDDERYVMQSVVVVVIDVLL